MYTIYFHTYNKTKQLQQCRPNPVLEHIQIEGSLRYNPLQDQIQKETKTPEMISTLPQSQTNTRPKAPHSQATSPSLLTNLSQESTK